MAHKHEFLTPYKGRVRPGRVAWTRVILTLVIGAAICLFVLLTFGDPGLGTAALLAIGFAGYALWAWMRTTIGFVVDERGLTPKLGGFLARPTWPLEDFRTVQIRVVAPERVGSLVGNIGLGRADVAVSTMSDVQRVDPLKPRTLVGPQADTRFAVTHGGELVEIIGRDGGAYLLSPEHPREVAEAIAKAITFAR
ncbi:hypothetical protein [Dermabacter hominis]|uniref:hypothetical protein n=1 Tax=Dermabacter hominis TaxID=36740 RepID=UPI0021A83103|nr:hypothetical protein [Dermabacter hominis]MCT1715934.1 hypothetical protein [Dermabacter hominis]